MSGPYPPGYPPPPEQDGWWAGENGQSGVPHHTVPSAGWGEPPRPPRPPRSTGRLIVAVVSVLVIVGGVATGIVLLNHKHSRHQAAGPAAPPVSVPASTAEAGGLTEAPTDLEDPGVPNGHADRALADGTCVSAVVDGDQDYTVTGTATCGSARSDLILVVSVADLSGCADHQYLRLSAPSAGVYCFTLDITKGDCVDENYLKTSCSDADFQVLSTEDGPGGSESCTTSRGATHWVPIGRDPVRVGCLGRPASP